MRAMILEEKQPIETSPLKWVELPDPIPGPGQVRVRVQACGICRTDLHLIEGELPPSPLPIVPGHQVVGIVDQLGPDCKRLKIGQRVGIAWLHSTCGRCRYCLSGKENLCERSSYTGYDVSGGYAEYGLAFEDYVYPLSPGTSSNAAGDATLCPLLCSGIIGFRSLERSRLPENGDLGIFGFGSSAHIVIQLAKAQGARVFVVTRAPEHQELALSLGASWAGENASRLPTLLDSAILFAPAGELVPTALRSLRKGGTLAIAGIHLSAIPSLDYSEDLFFERDLRSVTANTRQDGAQLLETATRLGPSLNLHIQTYPIRDANRALQDLKHDRIQGTGVLLI